MATSAHGALRLPDIDPAWTSRQREVLDMLVQGRTNGEIAVRLGISLEGAKWHVSEILSKLGVDSREEAAEYWRYQNGMRMRFLRVVRALTSATVLRWLVIVAAGAASVAVVAVVVAMLAGDGGEPASPEPPPPAASATPQPTPTPTPATTTTPAPGAPTLLQPGMRGLIGYDSVAYYGVTCYGCGGELHLFRAHHVNAQLVIEELLPGTTGLPRGSFYTFAADYDRGVMYVGACLQGYCGQEGDATADAQNVLLQSTDGGVTWEEVGSLPPNAVLRGVLSDGRLLTKNSPAGSDYHFFGSNEAPTRPPAPFEGWAFVDASGTLFWRDFAAEHLYDDSGAEIILHVPAGSSVGTIFDRSGSGDLWGSWLHDDYPSAVFGRFEPGSAPGEWDLVESWTSGDIVDGDIEVNPRHLLPGLSSIAAMTRYPEEPCLILGCGVDPTPRSPAVEAAIVLLDSASIHPIHELSMNLDTGEHPFIHAIASNLPYMTVNAPGECLNVREGATASANVITCAADRVLLMKAGNTAFVEGVTWQPVRLWDGREGWVASEFLLDQD